MELRRGHFWDLGGEVVPMQDESSRAVRRGLSLGIFKH